MAFISFLSYEPVPQNRFRNSVYPVVGSLVVVMLAERKHMRAYGDQPASGRLLPFR